MTDAVTVQTPHVSAFVRLLIGAPRGRTIEEIADEVGLDHDTARHIAKSPLIKAFCGRST